MKLMLTVLMAMSYFASAQTCIPNSASLSFSSSSADCTTDNNLNITDSITVEAWIYSTSWGITSAQNTIVCKHSWSQQEQGYVLRAGGTGELSWNFAGLDTNGQPVSWTEVVSTTGALSLNTWHHVAGTYDGEMLRIYIDGVLAGSAAFTGSMVAGSSYPLKIGRLADTGQFETRYWNGRIDEVRIWHRSLSQSEIAASMSMHIDSTSAGLVGYWRFNEGSGGVSNDLSASNNEVTVGTQWSTNVPFNDAPPVPVITLLGFALTTNVTGVTYQWALGGVDIQGATQSSYTPVQSGMYTVTVTSTAGCSSTSGAVNYIVGIEEPVTELSFKVWTNNNNLIIHLMKSGIFKNCNIYDVSGRLVHSQEVQFPQTEIHLSAARGSYTVMLEGDEAIAAKKFFIK